MQVLVDERIGVWRATEVEAPADHPNLDRYRYRARLRRAAHLEVPHPCSKSLRPRRIHKRIGVWRATQVEAPADHPNLDRYRYRARLRRGAHPEVPHPCVKRERERGV